MLTVRSKVCVAWGVFIALTLAVHAQAALPPPQSTTTKATPAVVEVAATTDATMKTTSPVATVDRGKALETTTVTAVPAIKDLPPTRNDHYCAPSLCEFYNGQDTLQLPHIACRNNESFGATCGAQPHMLYMSERRRNLILDMHNLARSRIAAGQLEGYQPAAHMPLLKWDNELEHLAGLHVRRCMFAHDQCRNTVRYQYSGQNIGYFWIGREFRSHSRRMKTFILNWFREYRDANQTFIDSYHPHPNGTKIGHFTLVVADRAHRIGCSAVRFRDPSQMDLTKFLMTCNYDFTNILGEPVYQTGPTASKCVYKISDKFPALCDWKDAVYDYDSAESVETETVNEIENNNIVI